MIARFVEIHEMVDEDDDHLDANDVAWAPGHGADGAHEITRFVPEDLLGP
jgi:hypothetical protein